MDEKTYTEAVSRMEKTLSSLRTDLNKIRTGRASLALFDDIRMDYYGTPTPLSQMATLSVPEPRLISRPWWFWENYKARWLRDAIGDGPTAFIYLLLSAILVWVGLFTSWTFGHR